MRAIHFDSVTSTNDCARELVRSGAVSDWAYVLANAQTQGRGTHGRRWHSPPFAGIYLSLIRVSGPAALPTTADFTRAAGVACAAVIEELTGLRVRLRPVNDILIGTRKLGGILTEALVEDDRIQALIVGVGLNLSHIELPPDIQCPGGVTSLEDELPAGRFRALRVGTVVDALVDRLRFAIQAVNDGHVAYLDAYRHYAGDVSACEAPS